jgi:hypothetical protein
VRKSPRATVKKQLNCELLCDLAFILVLTKFGSLNCTMTILRENVTSWICYYVRSLNSLVVSNCARIL